MNKVLVGVDPSYTRTGIAVYKEGSIYVDEVRGEDIVPKPFSKSFEGIWIESRKISDAIFGKIAFHTQQEPAVILSECPPPQGSYAPGLYALDTRLFNRFMERPQTLVYRVYPNYLMHIHGKRNYQKSESVELAKEILSEFDTYIVSKRLSHDESEAVIFLSRLLYKAGLLPDRIVKLIPNIKNEKEAQFLYE